MLRPFSFFSSFFFLLHTAPLFDCTWLKKSAEIEAIIALLRIQKSATAFFVDSAWRRSRKIRICPGGLLQIVSSKKFCYWIRTKYNANNSNFHLFVSFQSSRNCSSTILLIIIEDMLFKIFRFVEGVLLLNSYQVQQFQFSSFRFISIFSKLLTILLINYIINNIMVSHCVTIIEENDMLFKISRSFHWRSSGIAFVPKYNNKKIPISIFSFTWSIDRSRFTLLWQYY